MSENNSFRVRTMCATYNHESYISDALKGFVIQETTFPVVYTIVDDASTDRTAEVIREFVKENFALQDTSVAYEKDTDYGHVTFARHKTNKNCFFAVIYLKENHYSQKKSKAPYLTEWMDTKYVALCEGDDYWTDPLKLQKQVDFLEGHPGFSMCCHGADVKNETLRRVDCACEHMATREYFSDDAFPTWQIPTASIVYRRNVVEGYQLKNKIKFVAGDVVLILTCMHVGRVWGMEEHMSVYRMNSGGATSHINTHEDRLRLCEHYDTLMQNFPMVDSDYCHRYIAMVHYTNFRTAKDLKIRYASLWKAIVNKPSYVLRKVLRLKTKPRKDLFYQHYKC